MSSLIKNELKKFSKSKLFFSSLILIFIIFLIIYFNKEKDTGYVKNTVFTFLPFLNILVCILFGGIVSNEFSSGTIRVYMTKPNKRWKVLLSKLVLIYLIIIFIVLITTISYSLFLKMYFNYSLSLNYIKDIFISIIPMFFVGTFAMFLSVLTSNTAVSVGLSILMCFSSSIVAQLLFGFDCGFIKYTFLPYVDFSIFKDKEYLLLMKEELGINLTQNCAIIVIILNILLFTLLSLNIFTKKDIKS